MDNYTNDVTVLSSKGQIVLPKSIRDSLSLKTGSKLMVITDGENILIKPLKNPNKKEFSLLMKQAQEWAKSVGMKEKDIDDAIKEVRRKK